MIKKFSVVFSVFLLLSGFLSLGIQTASADTFYEGTGINRSKCTFRRTYSSSDLKKMGETYNSQSARVAQIGIVAALTPVIGKLLGTTAGLISSEAGLRGNSLIKKGNEGYKAKEYYCQKVKWDGYSRKSYVKFKFVK